MNAGIEIVRYQSHHQDQVLRLQQHLWGRDARLNQAYFAWRYQDNPYLPGPKIVLALHRGEVIGMRGIIGAKWRLGTSGRAIVIPFVDDFVIAPEYRGQGLAGPLIRAACAYARDLGHAFVLSLRAGHLTLLDSLAAGFRSIGAMEPVGRTRPEATRFRRGIRRLLQKTPVLWRWANAPLLQPPGVRRPFRSLDRPIRGPGSGPGGELSVERMARPAAMAELIERLPSDDRIRHLRDGQYFDWVFRNPRLEFRFLYRGIERLEGYLVLQREPLSGNRPGRVWIADWEGTSETACRDLLETAVTRGRFADLATWTATLPAPARTMLIQAGFEPIELEARARGRPAALIWPAEGADFDGELTIEGRRLTTLDNWKFRFLD